MAETTDTTDQTDEMSEGQAQDNALSAAELVAELQKARDALTKTNKENAERRKKMAEYEAQSKKWSEYEEAEQKRKEAELSEMDKLNKRLADAESAKEQALRTANERLLKAAFVAEAALAGAEHPGDAFLLADKTSVTIDDDGNVTGAAEAVKAIVESGRLPLKDKRRAPSLDGGKGGSGNPADTKATNLTEAELAQARKMRISPEQYAANKQK